MEFILYVLIVGVAGSLIATTISKRFTTTRADVWSASVIIIILSLLAIYRMGKSEPTGQPCTQDRTYEITEYTKVPWQQLINGATYRVFATGIVLTPFERPQIQELINKVKNIDGFTVKLFMLKPDGKAVEARAADEGMTRNPAKIAEKLLTIRELIKSELSQKAKASMMVKCIDVYPTIAVIIIDHDLYTYSYPYGARGTDSPVIIFRNFESNPQISNLVGSSKKYLESIEANAKEPTEADYAKYEKMISSSPH
jgi:hypothetical protein